MSRRIIPSAPGSPEGRETTVGWDAPLNTFFAVSIDTPAAEDDDAGEVFWVGATPGEIPTVEALAAALREHGVTLPDEMADQLAADQACEGDRSAGRPGTALIAAMHTPGGAR